MTNTSLTVALIQLSSTNNISENIESISRYMDQAKQQEADLIVMPEMCSLMEQSYPALLSKVGHYESDTGLKTLRDKAGQLSVHVLIGSMPFKQDDKLVNRSILIAPNGEIIDYYDKIHMFDVTLPHGETYQESNSYKAGDRAVVADLPWGKMGLTICYDVRFPYLYRHLAQQGASIISVPAAFTKVTGEAHWHSLLRARAIETGCFIVAPNQVGQHQDDLGRTRDTYGHSLVIDPWGNILVDMKKDIGISVVKIDLEQVEVTRQLIPSLQEDRKFN